MKVNLDLN
jgi:hypothetical protein